MSLALELSNDAPRAAMELSAARAACAVLEQHYPGWGWMVEVDAEQGIVKVHSMRIPGKWGFLLKMSKLDYEGKALMRAGGELLERYNLLRARHKPGATLDVPRDHTGRMVPSK